MQSRYWQEPRLIFNSADCSHGYPSAIKQLVSERLTPLNGPRRLVSYHGYIEQGSTTTPWSMLRLNLVDRYSIAQAALGLLSSANNPKVSHQAFQARMLYEHQKRYHESEFLCFFPYRD